MFRSDSAELGVGPSFVPVYSIARPMEGCSGDVQLFRSSTAKTTCWVRNILPRVRFHALLRRLLRSMVQCMTLLQILDSRTFSVRPFAVICGLLLFVLAPGCAVAEAPAAAVSTFNSYVGAVESRLAQQHRSSDAFLAAVASDPQKQMRLRRGELIVERVTPSATD